MTTPNAEFFDAEFFERERARGHELLRWQAERRAAQLSPLVAALSDLACYVLVKHPGWKVQEQTHLRHASLEIAACPQAEAVVVECHWDEAHDRAGTGAAEMWIGPGSGWTITRIPAADLPHLPWSSLNLLSCMVEIAVDTQDCGADVAACVVDLCSR